MHIQNADVQAMLILYLRYRQGNEPLPSMAYFCGDVFTKRLGKDSRDAADKHKINHKLIKKVMELSSNRGGDQARHQSAIGKPLTQPEVRFLEKAVAAMIIRAAMVAADPKQPMDNIDGNNLLEITP